MILSSPSLPVQEAICPPPSLPVEALRQQVRSFDPLLQSDSSMFQAAMLLLAAGETGQNVDRLARYTGFQRDFVARCARRLCDNGVWRNGNVLYTWTDANADMTAFWKDVQVAEGKLCRRTDEQGQIEWAPAGYWTKSYDYVERQPASELGILYLSPAAQALCTDAPVDVPSDHDEPSIAQKRRQSTLRRTVSPGKRTLDRQAQRTGSFRTELIESRTQYEALPRGTELFPDAAWLM